MTSNSNKLRAVFLTALMIGSVFAAGIAFTGSVAAQESVDDTDLRKATHYDNGTDPVLELAFEGAVTNTSVEDTEFTLGFSDGTTTTANATADVADNDSRVVIAGSEFNSGGEVNTSLETVEFNGNEYDVTVAPATLDMASAGNNEAYVGTNVALANDTTDSEFEIETPDDGSTTRGSGTGSHVYVYDTDDLSTGDYNVTVGDDVQTNTLTLENLGLTAEADSDSFTTADNVTVTAESNDINRGVEAVLIDEDGDETDYPADAMINADGEAELNFEEIAVDDVGTYTAEVTDVESGVTAETDEFEVTEEADDDSEFVTGTVEAERGDITTVNVSVTSNTEATVVIGEADESGYQANVTLTDEDEDGYVEFDVNTYTMGENTATPGADAFVGGEDTGVSVTIHEGDLSEPIAADSYRMSVRAGDDATASAQDVGRFVVNDPGGVTGQNVWTAPGGTEWDEFVSDATLSEDDSIAQGDYVVHEFEASGIGGVLENASTDDDTTALQNAIDNGELSLTVEQTEASQQPNTDLKLLNYTEAFGEDVQVVADAENDSYYVIADLAEVNVTDADDEERSFAWGDDAYNASLTLDADNTSLVDEDSTASAEFDADERTLAFSQDEYTVEAADGQSVTGETSAASGTELTVRAESIESPGEGFIVTAEDVTVEDGTWTASMDFSDAAVDSTFELTAEGPDESASAEGSVVESTQTTTEDAGTTTEDAGTTTADDGTTTADDGTTADQTTADQTTAEETTEDDESGGGIPGFGMGIALIAIIGAALLALRNN